MLPERAVHHRGSLHKKTETYLGFADSTRFLVESQAEVGRQRTDAGRLKAKKLAVASFPMRPTSDSRHPTINYLPLVFFIYLKKSLSGLSNNTSSWPLKVSS